MRIQQKVASYKKIRKWKTGLISQTDGSKVVYLSADPNASPDFHFYVEYCIR